jgi:hypothetical protein
LKSYDAATLLAFAGTATAIFAPAYIPASIRKAVIAGTRRRNLRREIDMYQRCGQGPLQHISELAYRRHPRSWSSFGRAFL